MSCSFGRRWPLPGREPARPFPDRLVATVQSSSLTYKNVLPVRLLDACGALLSGLCAIHCALTPLLITALPALANHGVETGLRRGLVLLGIVGVGLGAWVHKSREALWPLAGAVIVAALFELHVVSMAWEVFPSLVLSALLIWAHAQNSRACHEKLACCPNEHDAVPFWGDFAEASPVARKRASGAVVALSSAVLVHAVVIALAMHGGRAEHVAPVASAIREIELEVSTALEESVLPAPALASTSALPSASASTAGPSAADAARSASSTVANAPAGPVAAAPVVAQPAAAPPVVFSQALGAPGASSSAPVAFGALGAPVAASSGLAANGSGLLSSAAAKGASSASTSPVDVARLARRPVQPSGLGARIEAQYPAAARAEQLSGRGSVRALVSANGEVVQTVALSEQPTKSSFAAACARALGGSAGWGTPLDDAGRPVSTWIRFTCEFGIRY